MDLRYAWSTNQGGWCFDQIYSCKRTLKPGTIHGRSTFCIESGDTFCIPISPLKVRCLKDSRLMDHYCELHHSPSIFLRPQRTQSTSYRYYDGYDDDAAYTSHAHGWSSGPTSALTFYVAGLTVTAPQGKNWALAPHVGGPMNNAQGGFSTGLGWFGVSWELVGKKGISLDLTTPEGTQGVFTVPQGISGTIKVNGKVVHAEAGSVAVSGGVSKIVVS